jgi:hypothetical protein
MNARASNHSVVAEQWVRCAPGSGGRQSASRRVSHGKIPKDCPRWSRQKYLRRLFDDVEFSYLVVVAAELALPIFLHLAHG